MRRLSIAMMGMLLVPWTAQATLLDFEDLQDLDAVASQYSTQGVTFDNAIALTAGFSLNEFDYPTASGQMAIGDDGGPLVINFANVTDSISAYFTYGSQLTFSAYDAAGALLGSMVNAGFDNLGSSELISLDFVGVSSLRIAGEWDGSFIMDDLNFNSVAPVPAPETLSLMGLAWGAMLLQRRRAAGRNAERSPV